MEKLLVHIARHGQSLGSFSEEEVREGVASKRFSAENDLAWKSGMTEWRPLREVMNAWSPDSFAGTVIKQAALTEPAWEQCLGLGFFKAFFQTFWVVLSHPEKTFSKMPTAGKFWRSLFYYGMAWSLPVMLLTLAQQPHILHEKLALLSPEKLAALSSLSAITVVIIVGIMLSLILIPLLMVLSCIPVMVGMFFWSLLTHGILRMLSITKEPLGATVRVMCYALGPLCVLQLIPIGHVVYVIFGMVFCFIGFKKSHHLSGWRTVVAVLVPFLLLILFWVGSSQLHVQDSLLHFFGLK